MSELSEHAIHNRGAWTGYAPRFAQHARSLWPQEEIGWGIWKVPESQLRALPNVAGKDVVELGCGTAYFSAWLARRGARPVGVDITPAQLDTARAMQSDYGVAFPLVEASAENVPLPDASFDVAISEYGASIWCDPERWLPEAARLLRPAGELVFLCNSILSRLCSPDDGQAEERLVRPQFAPYRVSKSDGGVEFTPSHAEWLRLLRRNGFEVLDLIEIQAPSAGEEHYHHVTREWARRWPAEEIWRARKCDV